MEISEHAFSPKLYHAYLHRSDLHKCPVLRLDLSYETPTVATMGDKERIRGSFNHHRYAGGRSHKLPPRNFVWVGSLECYLQNGKMILKQQQQQQQQQEQKQEKKSEAGFVVFITTTFD